MEHHRGPYEAVGEEMDVLAREIVDAAFRVHTKLGPGLLENVYEICLAHELSKRSISHKRQVEVPIIYDGIRLDAGLRLDLWVAFAKSRFLNRAILYAAAWTAPPYKIMCSYQRRSEFRKWLSARKTRSWSS